METVQLAFEFAKSLSEQLITLSTGVVALTITFAKDLAGKEAVKHVRLLKWSWGIYLVSIIFGIWTLMALTGTLMPVGEPVPANPSIGSNVRTPATLQILSFLCATGFILRYGIKTFKGTVTK